MIQRPAQSRRLLHPWRCSGSFRLMKLPNTSNVTRRSFVASVGVATVIPPAAALLAQSAEAAATAAHHETGTSAPASVSDQKPVYLFFNVAEAQFIEAACERLIPADESGA